MRMLYQVKISFLKSKEKSKIKIKHALEQASVYNTFDWTDWASAFTNGCAMRAKYSALAWV